MAGMPHDIDGVIPFSMLPKGVVPKIKGETYLYQHPTLGDIDLNVIKINPKTGIGNERATELYVQLFPDEYHKQAMNMVTNPNRENYAQYPVKILDINGNPMTEEQLMSKYNALKKTIQDSFEIYWDSNESKNKHQYRPLQYLLGNQPQTVHEVLQNIARKELGKNGKLLPKLKFGTPEENQALLESIGYSDIIAKELSTQPDKMQNALDYWYLADNTLFRAVNAGDQGQLGGTPQQVIRNLTQWNPVAGGGTLSGEGLNTTVFGWSGHPRDVSGLLQPRIKGLYENMPAQDAVNLVSRNMWSFGEVTKAQADAINKITNLDIQEGTPLYDMLEIIGNYTTRLPNKERAEKYNQILDILGVRGLKGESYSYDRTSPQRFYGAGNLNPESDGIGVNTGDIANNFKFKQIPTTEGRIEVPVWQDIGDSDAYNRNTSIPENVEQIISRLFPFRNTYPSKYTPAMFARDRKNQLQAKSKQNEDMMWHFYNKWLNLKRGEQQVYSNMLEQLRQNLTNQAAQGAQAGAIKGEIANSQNK